MSPNNGNADLVPLEATKSMNDTNPAEGNNMVTGAGDLFTDRNPASILRLGMMGLANPGEGNKAVTGAGDMTFKPNAASKLLLGLLGLAPASKKVEVTPKIVLKLPTKKLSKGGLLRVIPRDMAIGSIYSLTSVLEAGGGWTAQFFVIVTTVVFGLPAFMSALLQAKLVETYGTCTLSFLNHYFDGKVVGRSVAAHIFQLLAVENGITITIGDLVRLLATVDQHQAGVFKNAVDGDLSLDKYFEISAGRILFELTQGGSKPANFAQFKKSARVLEIFKLFEDLTEVDLFTDPHFFSPQGAVLTHRTFESLSKDGVSIMKEDLSGYNEGALPGHILERLSTTKVFMDSGCELPAITLAEFSGLHKALADREGRASRYYWWRVLGLGEGHGLAVATLRILYDGTVKAVLAKYDFADEDAPMSSQQYVGMAGDLLRVPGQPSGESSFKLKNFLSDVNARHVGAFIGQLTDVHFFAEQSCNSSGHRRVLKEGSCTPWEKLIIDNFKTGGGEDNKKDGDIEEGGRICQQQEEEVGVDQQGVEEGGDAVETDVLQAVEEGVGVVAEAAGTVAKAEVGMGAQTIPVPFQTVQVAPQPVLYYQGVDGSMVYVYEGEPAHLMWLEHQQLQQQQYELELQRLRQEEEELVRQRRWEQERAWRQQQEYKDALREQRQQQRQQQWQQQQQRPHHQQQHQQQQQWGKPQRHQQRAAPRPQQQQRRPRPTQNRNKQHHQQQRRHHQTKQEPQYHYGWEQQQQQQQQFWQQGPNAAFHHQAPMPPPFYRPSF